jgi:phosphomannomutase
MLTASHMPFNSNGLKFFTADGGLEKADITELLQRATQVCEFYLFIRKAWHVGGAKSIKVCAA